jgi:hypothetical protein
MGNADTVVIQGIHQWRSLTTVLRPG